MIWRTLSLTLPLLAATALAGCDGDDDGGVPLDPEQVATGQRLYETPVEGGNTFACTNCHAINEGEGTLRAGHPLGGATRRASFKNGQLDTIDDAINSCLTEWMNADPWEAEDDRMLAVMAYLESEAGSEAEVTSNIVEPPADLGGGDPAAGQALFNSSCVECHGQDGIGTQRAIAVSALALEPGYIARRVRTSGRPTSGVYTGLTGGVMPFWAQSRLSDDDVRDLVAFLSQNFDPNPPEPDEPEPDEPDPNDPDPDEPDPDEPDPVDPPDSGCGNDHPKVGQTAVLQEFFHDVGGIAEIIDNCTIEITEFDFDGLGIDVQIYGGFEGMYENGFSMSENLVRDMPYNAETVRFTLPDGFTLDDVGGVSVWCVPVGADFGSGTFQ
ncbi:MAG: DM13 domain-containing protein [Myxococcota bacterium]